VYILLGDRMVLSLPTKQKKQSVWLLISAEIFSNVFPTTAMMKVVSKILIKENEVRRIIL